MDGRNNNKNQTENKFRNSIFLISAITLMVAGFLIILSVVTKYKPLILLAFVEIFPVLTNLILTLPRKTKIGNEVSDKDNLKPTANQPVISETDKNAEDDEIAKCGSDNTESLKISGRKKKSNTKQKQKKSHSVKSKGFEFSAFYNKNRTIVLSAIIILIIALLNVLYWTIFSDNQETNKFSYFIPTAIICTWIAFLVMEKYCKHIGDEGVDNTEENIYYLSIIRSLRGNMILSMFAHIAVFIGSVLFIQNITASTYIINIIMNVFFVYETVFILLSLVVRLIRQELNTTPSLSVPVPGLKKENLSVINYLENNTGITMRSLWSIKLIKTVIPYSLVAVIVLLWGFSGLVNVQSYQQGAHYRFGKLQDELLRPGIHLTLPFGIDSVSIYDTEVIKSMTIGYSSKGDEDNMWTVGHGGEEYKLLLGGGKELVSINLKLEYKISDLKEYISNNSSPEMLLQAAAYETITQHTINTDVRSLLASDRAKLSRELKAEISERASVYKTGLVITEVILESIHPPIDVAEVYQKIISAGIDAEKIIIDAEAIAVVMRTEAQTEKINSINMEKTLAFESVSEAKAVIEEFMASVNADNTYSDKYRYAKYLKALTEAYKDGQVIIVGKGIDEKNIYIGNFAAK